MDRQLAERMVGAACLLAVLVLVVPAILDGNPDSGATITHPQVGESLDLRTHTIRLDGAERDPPVPTPVQPPVPVGQMPEPEPEPEPEPRPQTEASGPGSSTTLPVIRQAPPTEAPVVAPPEPVAEAAPAPAKSPPAVTPSGGDWIVQLGSFSSRDNADRLAAQVRREGFAVAVQGGGGSSGNLFRVRAGPEPDKAAAEALERRLAAAGFAGGRVGRQ